MGSKGGQPGTGKHGGKVDKGLGRKGGNEKGVPCTQEVSLVDPPPPPPPKPPTKE